MSSTQDTERPQAALTVAKRYARRERPLSALVSGLAVAVFLGAVRVTGLLPALVVGAVLVGIVRAPLFQPHGTVRLRTDDDRETVVEAFTGPTPPILAFEWGLADEITTTESGVTYRISYLLGIRSVAMTVQTDTAVTASEERHVELEVTSNGQPWATYSATIRRADGQTTVEYDYAANRRFGLRRIPQRLIAARYRDEILAVQGYAVVEREQHYYGMSSRE